jgi:acetolactate decarboxylase
VITLVAIPTALSLAAAVSVQASPEDSLYQVSTLQALQVGLLGPATDVRALKRHGDFGLGTYVGLDGEMVVHDGTVYQIPVNGKAKVAGDRQKVPFAAVTFFNADQRFMVKRPVDATSLGAAIDKRLPSLNYFYAVEVTGTFRYVQTRSVPRQSKPYPGLGEVVAQQRTFDLRKVKGTLVGLRGPAFVGSLNVPGYHWHFITANGRSGGHVLALNAKRLRVAVDKKSDWTIHMPTSFTDSRLAPKGQ